MLHRKSISLAMITIENIVSAKGKSTHWHLKILLISVGEVCTFVFFQWNQWDVQVFNFGWIMCECCSCKHSVIQYFLWKWPTRERERKKADECWRNFSLWFYDSTRQLLLTWCPSVVHPSQQSQWSWIIGTGVQKDLEGTKLASLL